MGRLRLERRISAQYPPETRGHSQFSPWKSPRHSRGETSPMMMVVTRSRPTWPTRWMTWRERRARLERARTTNSIGVSPH